MVHISRKTKQKELLQGEVKKFSSFFTAEELFAKASKKDAKLGIATVYRFLGELVTRRAVHSYTCERKTIYSFDEQSHCHFICERCGKKEHLTINSLDFIKSKIKGVICHFQIDVSGICQRCKEQG